MGVDGDGNRYGYIGVYGGRNVEQVSRSDEQVSLPSEEVAGDHNHDTRRSRLPSIRDGGRDGGMWG